MRTPQTSCAPDRCCFHAAPRRVGCADDCFFGSCVGFDFHVARTTSRRVTKDRGATQQTLLALGRSLGGVGDRAHPPPPRRQLKDIAKTFTIVNNTHSHLRNRHRQHRSHAIAVSSRQPATSPDCIVRHCASAGSGSPLGGGRSAGRPYHTESGILCSKGIRLPQPY